jgi:hypothetical protein
MRGRHATSSAASRGPVALLLGLATVLGVWFGVHGPAVSPATPTVAAAQIQPLDDEPSPDAGQHGGGR